MAVFDASNVQIDSLHKDFQAEPERRVSDFQDKRSHQRPLIELEPAPTQFHKDYDRYVGEMRAPGGPSQLKLRRTSGPARHAVCPSESLRVVP